MGRAVLVLNSRSERNKAKDWIERAPSGTRVTFQASKRTTDQNSILWACLSEIAQRVEWHGLKLIADDWKLIFMHALNSELRIVPSLDGKGFVNLGTSSSKLSKQEMSMLIELIMLFAAEHAITFSWECKDDEARAPRENK
jgi:hypothetical protein